MGCCAGLHAARLQERKAYVDELEEHPLFFDASTTAKERAENTYMKAIDNMEYNDDETPQVRRGGARNGAVVVGAVVGVGAGLQQQRRRRTGRRELRGW